jgi:hypothetical protein
MARVALSHLVVSLQTRSCIARYPGSGGSMDEAHRYRGLVRTSFTAGITMSAIATGALALGLATGLVPSSIFRRT